MSTVICERIDSSGPSLHLRIDTGDRNYFKSPVVPALCGARVSGDVLLPTAAWRRGQSEVAPMNWCMACDRLRAAGDVQLTMLGGP